MLLLMGLEVIPELFTVQPVPVPELSLLVPPKPVTSAAGLGAARSVPPENVTGPAPRLPAVAEESTPAESVVPPLKLFDPERVNVPPPTLLSEPGPLNEPA